MKTTAWTPAATLPSPDFGIDDEVVFFSQPAKINKRTTLVSSLMAGAAYASMGLPFEIRNSNQDELIRFEPGTAVQGYAALRQALMEISAHLDSRTTTAVAKTVEDLKAEAVLLYERGVADGMAAERERMLAGDADVASASPVVDSVVPRELSAEPVAPEVASCLSEVAQVPAI